MLRKYFVVVFVMIALVALPIVQAIAAEEAAQHIPLIGEDAPAFKAETTQGWLVVPPTSHGYEDVESIGMEILPPYL